MNKKENIEYYLFSFVIENSNYYCIAYVGDRDGFIIESGTIKVFSSINDMIDYCKNNNIFLEDEEISYCDINFVLNWVNHYNSIEIDCDQILYFWNTIQDLSFCINEYFYGNEDGENNEILYVYNQLFYGTNPRSMCTDNENMYYPNWDNEDIEILKKVIQDGIRIINKAFKTTLK